MPSHPHRLRILLIAAAVLLIVAPSVAALLQKWLWMRQLGYEAMFWTLVSIQWAMFGAAFLFVFLFVWTNIDQAMGRPEATRRALVARLGRFEGFDAARGILIRWPPRRLQLIAAAISAAIAIVFAFAFYAEWDAYLRFHYGGRFGIADPLFGEDLQFYVFRLPLYEALQGGLTYLLVTTLLVVGATYAVCGSIRIDASRRIGAATDVVRHLSVLLLALFAAWGWGFYLDHYNLVYSTLGVVYGAGYAADHVTRVALWVMVAASAAACVLLAFGMLWPRLRIDTLAAGFGVYVALYFLGVILLPALYQRYIVAPNELALETPYLEKYIASTREAYQLGAVQEMAYPALSNLTPAAIQRNHDTIENIRLWDTRPLLQTYMQTQAIRLYYQFYTIDTDRYRLENGYHQVMLSTRELAPELPVQAQTWVNQHLQFTHGSGVVMNFVSKVDEGGNPQYALKNVPPESDYGLAITRPEIYFGGSMRGYRIVGTSVKEFDYPKGNDNVYASYDGTGGIPLDSIWKRLLFAWTQRDINILLTSYLTPKSRIQFWRRARERVAEVAPFLRLDRDPYPVLSDGKLYWILDAYTASDYYPYANPAASLEESTEAAVRRGTGSAVRVGRDSLFDTEVNYIRNSVKVVVDMYNGSVDLYVMDPADPILAAYRRAFPTAFKPLDALSPDLKGHLRYPMDLFSIQADQYRTFHMTDPQVFYNREDLWEFPRETYAGQVARMRPYYVLMKLPGSSDLQYLLMTPFTPQRRDNMISWMAARSDFPQYGQMLFYRLPKERLVYGPKQVDAMIDQNTTISSQLTLWDQRGSRVLRGIQIVTPIENSFLYVVPLYLTAAGTNFPQLKRVIAVADGRVVMAPTLDQALDELFAQPQRPGAPVSQAPAPPATEGAAPSSASALERARLQLEQAKQAIRQGDWGKFGREMEQLEHSLAAAPE